MHVLLPACVLMKKAYTILAANIHQWQDSMNFGLMQYSTNKDGRCVPVFQDV